jgi:hypothetical protein
MSGGAIPGNGRKKGYRHAVVTKQRIKAGNLMHALYRCAMGEIEMSAAQITAATTFLRKVIPDLRSVEHSGQVTHRHVEEMSDEELIAIIARSSRERTSEATISAGDDGSVH